MRTCSVDGCDRRQKAKEFCRTHYDRWSWTGEPGPPAIRRGAAGWTLDAASQHPGTAEQFERDRVARAAEHRKNTCLLVLRARLTFMRRIAVSSCAAMVAHRRISEEWGHIHL